MIPTSSSPTASKVGPTGRMMNGYEKFMASPRSLGGLRGAARRTPAHADAQALQRQIDHRRGVERQQLAEQQAADDRDAERKTQFRTGAAFQRQRQRAEQGGKRRHHDRADPQEARPITGVARRHAAAALG